MKPEGSVIDYVSVELVDPLQTLSLFFGAAKSYLPESQIHDFLKTVAAGIDKHIYQKIVMV